MSIATPTRPHQDNVLMAFTTEQVARLAGITQDRLRYWEKSDVFEPTYVEKRESGPFRRIYSFQDLVNLRAIAELRVRHNVPLNEVRNVSAYLRDYRDTPWSRLAVRVYGRRLVFRDPRTGAWMAATPKGQLTFELELAVVREASERDARRLMRRAPDHYGKLSKSRNVMSNQWVISGTRIPVSAILSFHGAGYTNAEVLEEYPTLVEADIDAAIAFEEHPQASA